MVVPKIIPESDDVQFAKEQNPDLVVGPASEKLVHVIVIYPLDQLVGQLAPDELQHLDHRDHGLAVVGHL